MILDDPKLKVYIDGNLVENDKFIIFKVLVDDRTDIATVYHYTTGESKQVYGLYTRGVDRGLSVSTFECVFHKKDGNNIFLLLNTDEYRRIGDETLLHQVS